MIWIAVMLAKKVSADFVLKSLQKKNEGYRTDFIFLVLVIADIVAPRENFTQTSERHKPQNQKGLGPAEEWLRLLQQARDTVLTMAILLHWLLPVVVP